MCLPVARLIDISDGQNIISIKTKCKTHFINIFQTMLPIDFYIVLVEGEIVEEGHVVLAPSILLLMASHCFLQVSSLSI
jgi:hypothetical protein